MASSRMGAMAQAVVRAMVRATVRDVVGGSAGRGDINSPAGISISI